MVLAVFQRFVTQSKQVQDYCTSSFTYNIDLYGWSEEEFRVILASTWASGSSGLLISPLC